MRHVSELGDLSLPFVGSEVLTKLALGDSLLCYSESISRVTEVFARVATHKAAAITRGVQEFTCAVR